MKRLILAAFLIATPAMAQAPSAPQPKDYGQMQVGNMLIEAMGREATTGASLLAARDKIAELEAQIKTLEAKGATEPAKPATK